MVFVLALGLVACEKNGAVISESQYANKLVGSWQGTVAGESESISLRANGSFTSQLQQTGFIGTTLGQGVAGSVDGTWLIKGKVITLSIQDAEDAQPLNLLAESTIVSFNQNKLVMTSTSGGTSTFLRVLNL